MSMGFCPSSNLRLHFALATHIYRAGSAPDSCGAVQACWTRSCVPAPGTVSLWLARMHCSAMTATPLTALQSLPLARCAHYQRSYLHLLANATYLAVSMQLLSVGVRHRLHVASACDLPPCTPTNGPTGVASLPVSNTHQPSCAVLP